MRVRVSVRVGFRVRVCARFNLELGGSNLVLVLGPLLLVHRGAHVVVPPRGGLVRVRLPIGLGLC